MLLFNFHDDADCRQDTSGYWKRSYDALCSDFAFKDNTWREMADIYGFVWSDYCNSSCCRLFYWRFCHNLVWLEDIVFIFHNIFTDSDSFRFILCKRQCTYWRLSSWLSVCIAISCRMWRSDAWFYKYCGLRFHPLFCNCTDNCWNHCSDIVCKASAWIEQSTD